ncbi:MAG: MmgE/PrpD family protein [Deltaproteobacteria bacterium]|nr:MAG: MmgE/PrpD family protein [Deltaproteobacteria bacterium]
MISIARKLANFAVALKFKDLPRDVVHQAKRVQIDGLGCGIGAYSADACKIVHTLVEE